MSIDSIRSVFAKATVISVLLLLSVTAFAQKAYNSNTDEGGIRYTEELLIQTDRDIYIAGERVYLKIYKLNGITRTPCNISKVVYTDVADNLNNPVIQIKTLIKGYSGQAGFVIPDTLRTGNYLIRSCTKWMQNYPDALYSYKRISVINPFANINTIKLPGAGVLPDSVLFYPEGGRLISGIENRVGIKCFGRDGFPAEAEGIISGNNNDTLCRVRSGKSGYGFFTVRPEGSEKMYFVVTGRNGSTTKFALPAVDNAGISMTVNGSRESNTLNIHIRASGNFTPGGQHLYLAFSSLMAGTFKKELGPEVDADIVMGKDTLPPGLAKLMITDGRGKIYAERWVCNEAEDKIDYNIRLKDSVAGERSRIGLEIDAHGKDGRPLKTDMVVSVVKSFTVDRSNGSNITGCRQMPLMATMSTDPGFSDINDRLIFYKEREDLFKPADAAHILLPELVGPLITGTVTDNSSGEPLRNEDMVLSFVGRKAECKFARTDSKGKFSFLANECGTREIVIEPLTGGKNDYSVDIDNPFPDAAVNYKTQPFCPDSSRLAEINKAVISMQVKGIYDPFVTSEDLRQGCSQANNFYDEPVVTINTGDYIELNSMREIIKELIPGLSIVKKDGKSSFRLVNETQTPVTETTPMVLVDGVVYDDADKILEMSPKDLDRIEVLKSRYFVSDIVIDGIIHFITRKGNLSAIEFDRSLFRQEYKAIQPPFSFYSPDYSSDSARVSRVPDFRNTLYWNAGLSTGNDGRAEAEFYTSDEDGEYTVIVEGVTVDGKTGRGEKKIVVRAEKR